MQTKALKPDLKPAARNFEIQRIVRRANVRRIRGAYVQLLDVQKAMQAGDKAKVSAFFNAPGDAAVAMGLYLEDLKRAGMPTDAEFFMKFEPVATQHSEEFKRFEAAVKSNDEKEASSALTELRSTLALCCVASEDVCSYLCLSASVLSHLSCGAASPHLWYEATSFPPTLSLNGDRSTLLAIEFEDDGVRKM